MGELVTELREGRLLRLPRVRAAAEELGAGVRSVAEGDARGVLRGAGVPEPLWNADLVTGDGRWIARPDAYWPGHGVVLEVDSAEHHFERDAWQATQARRLRIEEHGLRVITVTPQTVREDPAQFVRTVRAALRSGSPVPDVRFSGAGCARTRAPR